MSERVRFTVRVAEPSGLVRFVRVSAPVPAVGSSTSSERLAVQS